MSSKWSKGSSGPSGDEHHNLIAEAYNFERGLAPHGSLDGDTVTPPVTASEHKGHTGVLEAMAFKPSHYTRGKDSGPSEVCPPLTADADKGDQDPVVFQCHGDNVGPMGTLRSGHNEISGVPFTFDETQITHPENRSDPKPGDPANTIPHSGRPPTLAYSITPESGQGADLRATETDKAHALGTSRNERGTRILEHRVRRLTPLECERLMGLPDNYTAIPGISDSARYRMLGNSIVRGVIRWIGGRIQAVDAISHPEP